MFVNLFSYNGKSSKANYSIEDKVSLLLAYVCRLQLKTLPRNWNLLKLKLMDSALTQSLMHIVHKTMLLQNIQFLYAIQCFIKP